ncbi:MAG: 5'-methylthioadenosine/S-adenosylhomocysteine nucleosidase [Muribaculaceae bacterium]|nr:5'-methylthioadenosine/S-adenosylhomocysteine nucleosidase [Muribaculaceae bacterium]
MKIGIIIAMDKERDLLLPVIDNLREEDGIHYGTIGHHTVAVMKSGMGKVNSALATKELIDVFHPDLIINSGVAGGTGSGIPLGSVVVGDRVVYHDVFCGAENRPGQADGCPDYFYGAEEVVTLPALANERHGLICSGDQFIIDRASVDVIRSKHPDVLAVDMESASIAHTCYRYNVPFCSIRVVSDTPGEVEDDEKQYYDFWAEAPKSTFRCLKNILASLK